MSRALPDKSSHLCGSVGLKASKKSQGLARAMNEIAWDYTALCFHPCSHTFPYELSSMIDVHVSLDSHK